MFNWIFAGKRPITYVRTGYISGVNARHERAAHVAAVAVSSPLRRRNAEKSEKL